MTAEELTQLREALLNGRKVCVINLAAFSMAVGNITNLTDTGSSFNLSLNNDKGEQVAFALENPVNLVTTPTGYRLDSDKLVLQVDFMPE